MLRINLGKRLFRLASLVGLVVVAVPGVAKPGIFEPLSSNPEGLTEMGGFVYFSADDGRIGRELWRTDLEGNAKPIKDITPGKEGSDISRFHVFNGTLYFRYRPKDDVAELWQSDGTAQGTKRFMRFEYEGQDQADSVADIVGKSDTRFFIAVGEDDNSKTLWESDGTAAGTRPLRNEGGQIANLGVTYEVGVIDNDAYFCGGRDHRGLHSVRRTLGSMVVTLMESSNEAGGFFGMDSGAVLFSAGTPETGNELWITRGDQESTVRVKDIYTGTESSDPQYFHHFLPEKESLLLFVATDAETGREIWQTDGTKEGTTLVYDVVPGAGSSNPYHLYSKGGALYFIAIDESRGKEVWATQFPEPPVALSDVNPGPRSSEPYNLLLHPHSGFYFSATDGEGDEELWFISDALLPAVRVADINPGPQPSYPDYAVLVGGEIVFAATSAVEGRELWIVRSDRSLELLADIHTDDSVNPASNPRDLTPTDFGLFFVANDIRNGAELWVTDGTDRGTVMVKDIFPGRASSNPHELTPSGGLLYFVAEDPIGGIQLWRSDGTTLGTTMCRQIADSASARVSGLTAFKDGVIFCAYRPLEGEELWIVRPGKEPDILKDINGGPGSSKPRDLVYWKGHVYFHADDGVHGEELWRTDGTKDGTVMVKDVVNAPVEQISAFSGGVGDEYFYFAAAVNGQGAELWRLSQDGTDLSLVSDIARRSVYDVRGSNSQVPKP